MSNEAPACHVERLETSHELSPCASLSRDDNQRTNRRRVPSRLEKDVFLRHARTDSPRTEDLGIERSRVALARKGTEPEAFCHP